MSEKRKLHRLQRAMPTFDCPDKTCSRCCGLLLMTEVEYDEINMYLRKMPRQELLARRVSNGSEDTTPLFDLLHSQPSLNCSLLDRYNKCLVYPVRPLVCRMFGSYKGLRCPFDSRPTESLATPGSVLISFLKNVRYFDLGFLTK